MDGGVCVIAVPRVDREPVAVDVLPADDPVAVEVRRGRGELRGAWPGQRVRVIAVAAQRRHTDGRAVSVWVEDHILTAISIAVLVLEAADRVRAVAVLVDVVICHFDRAREDVGGGVVAVVPGLLEARLGAPAV